MRVQGSEDIRHRKTSRCISSKESAIIFIDEIEGSRRQARTPQPPRIRSNLNQLLVEMDGSVGEDHKLLVMEPPTDQIDQALTRPGRFDRTVQVICQTKGQIAHIAHPF